MLNILAVVLSASIIAVPTVERRSGADWRDGTFLGDGQTGIIAYAPMHLEWLVNRNDVIDGRTRLDHRITHREVMRRVEASERKTSLFLEEADGCHGRHEHRDTVSAAVLRLRFWEGLGWAAPSAPEVKESMSLEDGVLSQNVRGYYLDADVESLVMRDKDVVAFRMRGGRNAVLEFTRPPNPLLEPAKLSFSDGEAVMEQKLPDGNVYAAALSVKGAKLSHAVKGGSMTIRGLDLNGEFFLAVRTTRETPDPVAAAKAAVRDARDAGYGAVADANRKWWNGFWSAGGRADFKSEREVNLAWHQCMFAMAASYGKPPMPGLNGLVYGPVDSTVAGIGFSDYTHDQNVQIPMFSFFPVNHCGFVRSFSGTYERVRKTLEENTRKLYGTRGIGLPLAINQDGYENPTGSYRYSLCGAAYSALVLAQAWRYSRDKEILRDIYPLLRDFVVFNLDLMHKDPEGRYRLDWMVPPEIFRMTRNELATTACLKTSLEVLVEASEILGLDENERARWCDVRDNYPKFVKQSEGGWWCGMDIPDDHCMYGGHLFYPFYPAEAAVDADARATTLKTVDYLKKYGLDWSYLSSEPHPMHDWTSYYLAVSELRLRPKENGWKSVTDFLRYYRKPNGFFAHNSISIEDPDAAEKHWREAAPYRKRRNHHDRMTVIGGRHAGATANTDAKRLAAPVIEGFGAFLFISTESLVQSWGGEIKVFPAVPPDFTGSFTNFLAQGGMLVSAEMKNGRLVSKTIMKQER